MEEKVASARALIKDAVDKYGLSKIAVACSFGKDSMVVTHIAKEMFPKIPVFSVMTILKPLDTIKYLVKMNRAMNLDVTVYFVGPFGFHDFEDVRVVYMDGSLFDKENAEVGGKLYEVNPDRCCDLLKVVPTKEAVKSLDAWICGLRNTEGRTRVDYREVAEKGGLIKVNPILSFTETDIWKYLATGGIEPHPWYKKGYRSLGCQPCSSPGGDLERDGRWKGTSKCGGECGIHTKSLKE